MLRNLQPELKWAIGGVAALLIVSTLLVWVLAKLKPNADFTEVKQRTKSWWIMAGVFSLAMALSPKVSIGFMALVSFLALKEYFSIIPTRRVDRRVLFWAYLAIPVNYFWIGIESYGMFIIFIPVYLFLLLPIRMILIGETKGFLRAAGTLHWGLMLTVYCIGHAGALLMLNGDTPALENAGAGLLFTLVVLTQCNDVAQFVWGKSIGKRKVVPKISPGKTWGGLIGGVLTTTCLSMAITPLLTPLSLLHAAMAGMIVGIAGFIGDVCVSALKRDLDIKDSGALIPGHGGILDRVDSLCYTAPFFFHFVRYFYFV